MKGLKREIGNPSGRNYRADESPWLGQKFKLSWNGINENGRNTPSSQIGSQIELGFQS